MASHRYVILFHDGVAEPHFDIMVETVPGGPLMTWRSIDWPIVREANVTRLGEHRRDYLDYEGPVSGDRGTVKRIAGGACKVEWQTRHDLLLEIPGGGLHLQCLDDDHWLATPHPSA